MKIRFVIAKANGSNNYWSYMRDTRYGYNPIVSHFMDRFLNSDITKATQFETYEEAEKFIMGLGMIPESFFKIEKVYIVH